MDFLLKFLILGGKYLTRITSQSIIEAYKRSVSFGNRLNARYERTFCVTGNAENMLELYNNNISSMENNPQHQFTFINDEYKQSFQSYLHDTEVSKANFIKLNDTLRKIDGKRLEHELLKITNRKDVLRDKLNTKINLRLLNGNSEETKRTNEMTENNHNINKEDFKEKPETTNEEITMNNLFKEEVQLNTENTKPKIIRQKSKDCDELNLEHTIKKSTYLNNINYLPGDDTLQETVEKVSPDSQSKEVNSSKTDIIKAKDNIQNKISDTIQILLKKDKKQLIPIKFTITKKTEEKPISVKENEKNVIKISVTKLNKVNESLKSKPSDDDILNKNVYSSLRPVCDDEDVSFNETNRPFKIPNIKNDNKAAKETNALKANLKKRQSQHNLNKTEDQKPARKEVLSEMDKKLSEYSKCEAERLSARSYLNQKSKFPAKKTYNPALGTARYRKGVSLIRKKYIKRRKAGEFKIDSCRLSQITQKLEKIKNDDISRKLASIQERLKEIENVHINPEVEGNNEILLETLTRNIFNQQLYTPKEEITLSTGVRVSATSDSKINKKKHQDTSKLNQLESIVQHDSALMAVNYMQYKKMERKLLSRILPVLPSSIAKKREVIHHINDFTSKIDNDEMQNRKEFIKINKQVFDELETNIRVVKIIKNDKTENDNSKEKSKSSLPVGTGKFKFTQNIPGVPTSQTPARTYCTKKDSDDKNENWNSVSNNNSQESLGILKDNDMDDIAIEASNKPDEPAVENDVEEDIMQLVNRCERIALTNTFIDAGKSDSVEEPIKIVKSEFPSKIPVLKTDNSEKKVVSIKIDSKMEHVEISPTSKVSVTSNVPDIELDANNREVELIKMVENELTKRGFWDEVDDIDPLLRYKEKERKDPSFAKRQLENATKKFILCEEPAIKPAKKCNITKSDIFKDIKKFRQALKSESTLTINDKFEQGKQQKDAAEAMQNEAKRNNSEQTEECNKPTDELPDAVVEALTCKVHCVENVPKPNDKSKFLINIGWQQHRSISTSSAYFTSETVSIEKNKCNTFVEKHSIEAAEKIDVLPCGCVEKPSDLQETQDELNTCDFEWLNCLIEPKSNNTKTANSSNEQECCFYKQVNFNEKLIQEAVDNIIKANLSPDLEEVAIREKVDEILNAEKKKFVSKIQNKSKTKHILKKIQTHTKKSHGIKGIQLIKTDLQVNEVIHKPQNVIGVQEIESSHENVTKRFGNQSGTHINCVDENCVRDKMNKAMKSETSSKLETTRDSNKISKTCNILENDINQQEKVVAINKKEETSFSKNANCSEEIIDFNNKKSSDLNEQHSKYNSNIFQPNEILSHTIEENQSDVPFKQIKNCENFKQTQVNVINDKLKMKIHCYDEKYSKQSLIPENNFEVIIKKNNNIRTSLQIEEKEKFIDTISHSDTVRRSFSSKSVTSDSKITPGPLNAGIDVNETRSNSSISKRQISIKARPSNCLMKYDLPTKAVMITKSNNGKQENFEKIGNPLPARTVRILKNTMAINNIVNSKSQLIFLEKAVVADCSSKRKTSKSIDSCYTNNSNKKNVNRINPEMKSISDAKQNEISIFPSSDKLFDFADVRKKLQEYLLKNLRPIEKTTAIGNSNATDQHKTNNIKTKSVLSEIENNNNKTANIKEIKKDIKKDTNITSDALDHNDINRIKDTTMHTKALDVRKNVTQELKYEETSKKFETPQNLRNISKDFIEDTKPMVKKNTPKYSKASQDVRSFAKNKPLFNIKSSASQELKLETNIKKTDFKLVPNKIIIPRSDASVKMSESNSKNLTKHVTTLDTSMPKIPERGLPSNQIITKQVIPDIKIESKAGNAFKIDEAENSKEVLEGIKSDAVEVDKIIKSKAISLRVARYNKRIYKLRSNYRYREKIFKDEKVTTIPIGITTSEKHNIISEDNTLNDDNRTLKNLKSKIEPEVESKLIPKVQQNEQLIKPPEIETKIEKSLEPIQSKSNAKLESVLKYKIVTNVVVNEKIESKCDKVDQKMDKTRISRLPAAIEAIVKNLNVTKCDQPATQIDFSLNNSDNSEVFIKFDNSVNAEKFQVKRYEPPISIPEISELPEEPNPEPEPLNINAKAHVRNNSPRGLPFVSPVRLLKNSLWNWEMQMPSRYVMPVPKEMTYKKLMNKLGKMGGLQTMNSITTKEVPKTVAKKYKYQTKQVKTFNGTVSYVTYLVEDTN